MAIEVSLKQVFSQNGLNIIPCCPKCKSGSVVNRTKVPKWICRRHGCNWKGDYPAYRLNEAKYNYVLDRILEQAQIQKNVVIMALNEGVILPVEITEGI